MLRARDQRADPEENSKKIEQRSQGKEINLYGKNLKIPRQESQEEDHFGNLNLHIEKLKSDPTNKERKLI